MTKTYTEPSKEIPVWDDVDVVVCGGGPAGVGAALAAARNGAKTVVIENHLCLGGMATAGLLNRLGPYHNQKEITLKGIPWEILRKLVDRGLAQEPIICAPKNWMDYWLVFDPEAMKRLLDELMLDAGVKMQLATQVVAPIMQGNTIKGVIIENKSGRQAIMTKMVIDCTGDADIAARAGAPFAMGREGDGLTQPFTLMSKYLNMDWPKAFKYVREHYQELLPFARERGNNFVLAGTDNYMHPEESYFNCLHMHNVSGIDADDITQSAIELRRMMWANMDVLREHVPGCEKISLITSAAAMGVRETRRIEGEYTLTDDDVLDGKHFDDQVFQYACFVDIHEPKAGQKSEHADRCLQPGQTYGVPFRSLVPKKIENLMVSGRCLSATHVALASVRMIPSCMAMGQATGTAAAMCCQQNIAPRQINIGQLQDTLKKQGVNV